MPRRDLVSKQVDAGRLFEPTCRVEDPTYGHLGEP